MKVTDAIVMFKSLAGKPQYLTANSLVTREEKYNG